MKQVIQKKSTIKTETEQLPIKQIFSLNLKQILKFHKTNIAAIDHTTNQFLY